MSSTDKQILRLLAGADSQRRGFEMLVAAYSETLYWRIRRIVLTHDDADDVLQNTFIKAWTSLSTFRGEASLSTWLYRIAVNESLDFLRRQKARPAGDADEGVAASLMADDYFDGDATEALLQEAIAQLPDVQRLVFHMRYYEGMRYADMARTLQRTEGALKASYHIAMKKVTEYIRQHS